MSQENINLKHESELETQKLNTRKLQSFAILAFVVLICALLFGTWYIKGNPSKEKKQVENDVPQVQKKEFLLDVNKPEPPKFPELLTPTTPTPKVDSKQNTNTSFNKPYKTTALIVKGSGQTVVGNNKNVVAATSSSETPKSNDNVTKETDKKIDDTDKDFTGETFAPSAASVGKFNPSLLLSKGTYIGCSMNTRLVSDIKGGVACTVSENVYSENGHTLLVEKGSRITGMFKSGQLNDGMERIFVIWQEIRTPQNIIIPVYSGASDELGGSGMPGYVDHHWAQRFGAAILLSVIDDALNFTMNGQRASSGSSNADYTSSTRENTQQMANTALEKMINIQPTLYKNQGDLVGVYVNRDIDFSKVYKLVRKDQSRDNQ